MNRGEIVEKKVRESGIALKHLANRLDISRGTLYNYFQDPNLSARKIKKIGEVINFNFGMVFKSEELLISNDPLIEFESRGNQQLSQCLSERKIYMEKYLKSLEDKEELMTQLMEERERTSRLQQEITVLRSKIV